MGCGISKRVGPKKQDFWPRINKIKGILFLNLSMNYGLSKSAKIVLSKSIFDVKNQLNFFFKKRFYNISLEDQFLMPTTLNHLWFSVDSKNQSFLKLIVSLTLFWVPNLSSVTQIGTHIYFFYFWFKNKRVWAKKIGKNRKNSKNLKVAGNYPNI